MKHFNKLLLLCSFFLSTFTHAQFTQIGLDIDGEYINDNSGKAVSLNTDGTILAIGAPNSSDNLSSAGHVRVYEWSGSAWVQKGSDIDGANSYDEFGSSLTLNANGTILAVGAPKNNLSTGHVRIYEWDGNNWVQKGNGINGENSYDEFGHSLTLNAAGDMLAIGAPKSDGNGLNSGSVKIYEWNGNTWIQKGAKLEGLDDEDTFGSSVSFNDNGIVLAVGAPRGSNGISGFSGHVLVYEWNGNAWVQRGNNLNGGSNDEGFGFSVSLSGTGAVVAVGAPNNVGVGASIGYVEVLNWDGNSWNTQGQDIDGEAVGDGFGESVSLSGNGSILAIGGSENGWNNNSGFAKVYEWNVSTWNQRSTNIYAEDSLDLFGISVSLSKDGNTLAAGAPFNDGNGINAGHVRVYDMTSFSINIDRINAENALDISTWPNPTTNYLYVNKKNNEKLFVELVDELGKQYKSFQTSEQISSIDLSRLPVGIYFLKIRSDKKITTRKIVKK